MKLSRRVIACAGSIYLLLCGAASAQTSLRIVASNLTGGTNQQSYAAPGIALLQALNPDVCLMQEFNVNTVSGGPNDTAAVTSFVNSTFGSGFFWFRETGAQIPNGVVSRYPIINSGQVVDSSVSNRSFAWARIDIPGPTDLFVISVHLLSTGSTERNTEANQILNTVIPAMSMPAGSYLALGGDFNTDTKTESCISTLSSTFVTGSPWPAGQTGDTDTNAGRNKPYDWVLANSALNAIKTTTTYGSFSYANGLVFDTRDFTQAQLDANFPPAQVGNSGALNMQHMGIVRTFTIPASTPVTGGDTATVSTTDRAPSTAQVNSSAAMLSVNVSTTTNEWDVATIRFNRLGTAPDSAIAAKVYQDTNNNGVVDAGEALLGSGSFAAGTTNISLSPAPRATPGTPARLLGVVSVLNTATSGSTVQLQLAANGITHAASGGADVDPTYPAATSSITNIVSAPIAPVVVGSSVIINKYLNAATDALELLVVQDHLDMRGMIVKDYSSSMANDNGGNYVFTSNALWADLRAGTIIVLRKDATAADVISSDRSVDVGLTNATYFTTGVGTLDIATVEMVMIKIANSGVTGSTGIIHALAGGAAGTQYTNTTSTAKLRAASGTATGQYVIVDNQTTQPGNNSVLSNFYDGSGFAYGAVTTATLGAANGPANQDFITFLRGPVPLAADQITGNGFQANWNTVVTATNYHIDVASDAAFGSLIPGYSDLDVGSATSTSVSGLSATSNYYYRVRGVNIEGTPSGSSSTITVTTTAAVKDWALY